MPQTNKYVVKVQNRSGFDKSHRNTLTLTTGTITPILLDELIPGSRVNLKLNLACQLAPLVSDTYMNVKLKAEAFFVPLRLLCKSFEDFYCDSKDTNVIGNLTATASMDADGSISAGGVDARIPHYDIPQAFAQSYCNTGSLSDYLGFTFDGINGDIEEVNILPFVAYQLVYQEWYRNPRVQKPCFVPWHPNASGVTPFIPASALPYWYFHNGFTTVGGTVVASNVAQQVMPANPWTYQLADGHSLFDLRQRNFGADYFTNGRVDSQQGAMSRVVAPVGGDGNPGFTIAAVRLMNSLQQYKERNNIPSPRMVDVSLNRYGVSMSDGVAQRPICLGSASYDVYSRGVDQTGAINASSSAPSAESPFKVVGTTYGKAHSAGSDFIIDDFEAKEPGYLLVNVTLVPEASYSAGVSRIYKRYCREGSITDMANPLLQNVGDQPIYNYEVSGKFADFRLPGIFAYQDRYSDWMYMKNEIHGLVRPSGSLQAFVLQRNIAAGATLSDSFLQIPINFFDSVMVEVYPNPSNLNVHSKPSVAGFTAWLDSMLQYRVSMPLAEYSIPSLQNPAYEHGKTVVLRRNGQIF